MKWSVPHGRKIDTPRLKFSCYHIASMSGRQVQSRRPSSSPSAQNCVNVSIQKKIAAGFGVAVLVLLFVAGAAAWNANRFDGTFQQVDRTYELVGHLEKTLIGMLSMQTSTYGYVLTGDEKMLDPFREGIRTVADSLHQVRELTKDNPRQQRRLQLLDPTVALAAAIMQERINARRERGLNSVQETDAFQAGQEAVSRIRKTITEIEEEERELLGARVAGTRAAARSTVEAMAFGGF